MTDPSDDELRAWLREEFTRNDPIAKHMQRVSAMVERLCQERDALKVHFDAAAPEHNLPALLDLYCDRMLAAEDDCDALIGVAHTNEGARIYNAWAAVLMLFVARAEGYAACQRDVVAYLRESSTRGDADVDFNVDPFSDIATLIERSCHKGKGG